MKTISALSGLVAIVLLSGCTTLYEEERQSEARANQLQMNTASDVAMLKERIAGIETAQEQISRDMAELKSVVSRSASAGEEMQVKLDSAVRALEARDNKIYDDTIKAVSVKMAEILKRQGTSAGPVISGTGVEHVVEPGQTLSAIAQAYGVTLAALVKANNLQDPNSVRVGQKLFIPR